jgi:hypothetical protein
MKTLGSRSLATFVAASLAVSALAFQSNATWPGADTTLSLNTTSFPAGNVFNSNAQFAMSDWNAVTGSDFTFFTNATGCGLSSLPTSDNCVFFTSGTNIGGALGLTSRSFIAGVMTDADVRFNVDASWTPDLNVGPFTFGPPFSFRGVARHEFGHALGLCHEDGAGNTVVMNSIYSAGAIANMHWDDRNAARTLYPGAGTERELIPYMWKKTGNGQVGCGQSSSTVSVPVANVTAQALPGGTAVIEFSFENAGNLPSGNFDIDFLLSTNNIISTGDTLVGRNFGASASAHSRGTFTRTVTIPAGTPLGTFFTGICVDTGNTVGESVESNNCALAPGTLQVVAALPPPPPPPPATLRVIQSANGTGTGTVTSSPAGISCGADCLQSYANGTVVTLTPRPAAGSSALITGDDPDCLDGVVTMNRDKTCRVLFENDSF